MKKQISIFLILFTCVTSIFAKKLPQKNLSLTNSDNQQIIIKAEIADDEKERERGYMFRKTIPEGTGMLFIFDHDQILSFWMKNTPHPLSIAYIDSKGIIKNIYDMKPHSLSPIISTVSVRYALEVPQGWFKEQNINIGDKIDLSSLK